MKVDDYDSLILYVGNLSQAKAFYVDMLGLPVRFEDEIIIVVGGPSGQIVLHRNDRDTTSEGSFRRGQLRGLLPSALGSTTLTNGRGKRGGRVCPSCGPLRTPHGGVSWL